MAFKITKDTKGILIRTKDSEEYHMINGTVIDRRLYVGKSDLIEVVIPEGITLIDEEAFMGCDHLTTISLPSTIKMIRRNAFLGCHGLQNVILPDSVTDVDCWGERRTWKISSSKPFDDLAGYLKNGCETEFNPDFDWN
jgi:hypothetical protein